METKHFAIVGAGGIGHYIAPLLARFLGYHHPGATLTIIDGDVIEDRNLSRCFSGDDLGEPKAEILAEVCAEMTPEDALDIRFIDEYIKPDTYERFHRSWLKDGITIFGCVDNNKSRYYLEEKVSELNNAILINGGNDLDSGQAQMYVRKDGEDLTPPISHFAPEILSEGDPYNIFPGEEDCSKEYEARPQLSLANAGVAMVMLQLFYSQCVDSTPKAESFNEALFSLTGGLGVAFHQREALPQSETVS